VRITEENGYDLIVMASSRISSSVRLLGSTTKGVIDSIRKPVLIIHELRVKMSKIKNVKKCANPITFKFDDLFPGLSSL
jgi:hypothetical protein